MNNDFLTVNGQTSTSSNKSFDVPDDIYDAVVIGIANLGEVESTYQGEVKKSRKISIAFALDYQYANGDYAVVTQRYTLSLHEKSTLGKLFAKVGMPANAKLGDLLGKQVRVDIVHNGEYVNVDGVKAASKSKLQLPEGIYLPSWWYTNNYEMGKATGIMDGARPKREKGCQKTSADTEGDAV